MTEQQLAARRDQFCAAYEKALSDPAFRTLLHRQPGAAMSQFGFTVVPPVSAIGLLLPAVQKIHDHGPEPPPV
ncbi:MAG: hypothetical protein R2762_28515 [Bryobacteraceae bacterium]